MKYRKSNDVLRQLSGEAERAARVRKLAKVAARKPGRRTGLDPDAAKAGRFFAEGRADGERASRDVSVQEQRERYAATQAAMDELTARMVGYYCRERDELE